MRFHSGRSLSRADDQVGVEEREAHAVAGGPHDEVGRRAGAVDEDDPVAVEPLDRRARGHRAGARGARGSSPTAPGATGRACAAARGRPYFVMLPPATVAPIRSRSAVTHHGTQPGGSSPWSLGLPRKNLRSTHSVRRTDHVVVRAREGRLDRDVHRRVAGTDHDHVAARELVAGAVVVGVDLLAVERARVGRLGPPRVPVVAVGDQHGVVGAGLGAVGPADAYVPAAVGGARDVLDGRVEGDRVAEAEVVDVLLEVGVHLVVARVGRVVRRHREVGVGHPRARRVDLEGVVAGGLAVGVVEDPGAADVAALLEAVEGRCRPGRGAWPRRCPRSRRRSRTRAAATRRPAPARSPPARGATA